MRARRSILPALFALPLTGLLAPRAALAQENSVDAYFQGVAEHFRIPMTEVRVLAEWGIEPEEVPVVLFLARHAGVSPDALIALERGGQSWAELADRYRVGAGTFHVPLEGAAGPLSSAYESFRGTPSERWDSIELTERELIQLVNLKVLSEYLGMSPRRVLDARERNGSFVAAYEALVRSGG